MDKSVQPISIDEALILMTEKINDIEQVMNRIRIKDEKNTNHSLCGNNTSGYVGKEIVTLV